MKHSQIIQETCQTPEKEHTFSIIDSFQQFDKPLFSNNIRKLLSPIPKISSFIINFMNFISFFIFFVNSVFR